MASNQSGSTEPTYDLKRVDGAVLRGLSPREVRAMATAGNLYTDDLITRSGLAEWRSAAALAGLPVKRRDAVVRTATEVKPAAPKPPMVAAAIAVAPAPSATPPGPSAAEHAAVKEALASARTAQESLQADLVAVEAERDGLISTCEALTAERAEVTAALQSARREADAARSAAESTLERVRDEASAAQRALESAHQERIGQILERGEAERREATTAADGARRALEQRIEGLVHQLQNHPDSSLRGEVAELARERDESRAETLQATSDREELVAALGSAQDALRVSDDLRRTLEKAAAAAKSTAHEQGAEITQLKSSVHTLQSSLAAAMHRAENAEAAATTAARVQDEARDWVARVTEQRDQAVRARDGLVAERDGAFAERDATRLAVGATQTDLVRARHELDASVREAHGLRAALSAQTERSAGLERALALAQEHSSELEAVRDAALERCAANERELTSLHEDAAAARATIDSLHARGDDAAQALSATEHARDSARAEAAALAGDLAAAREAATLAAQRTSAAERDLAAERGKIVARDELIFRESLRTEEREAEIRRLAATIAGLNADLESEHRRADEALAAVSRSQTEAASARREIAGQNAQMMEAHQELDRLRALEQAARAGLASTTAERDQLAAAVANAHAEVTSREQQAAAERALREQAEASSRQLLASYEKLADETARRITDLEVRLSESAHLVQTVQLREEHALASLAEAHSQAKATAQRLAHVEESRAAVIRDRDSFAKQAKAEATARAAAEDKIGAANERATKAERDGRHALERSVQAAMITLGGVKQRLDEDYAKSRAEVETLEQLVAESAQRIIAAGGIVPGVPLLPREAAAAARVATEAAALIAAQGAAAQSAPKLSAASDRKEADRPAAPPVTFRLIDGVADDAAPPRAAQARSGVLGGARREQTGNGGGAQTPAPRVGAPTAGRIGGQRERVSHPTARSESAADDDSSSSEERHGPAPPGDAPDGEPAHQVATPHTAPHNAARNSARRERAAHASRLTALWVDDHDPAHTQESPANGAAVLASVALGVAITASLASIPDFLQLNLRGAFANIGLWLTVCVALTGIVLATANRCTPILARRIPRLAALLAVAAPLVALCTDKAAVLAFAPLICLFALPWLAAYAAWPDLRQLAALAHSRDRARALESLTARGAWAAAVAAMLAAAGVAIALLPVGGEGTRGIDTLAGAATALLSLIVVVLALLPTKRHLAVIPAWGSAMIALASTLAFAGTHGIDALLLSWSAPAVGSLMLAWCACAATSVACACRTKRLDAMLADLEQHESPALVAHERVFAAVVMASCAAVPGAPALLAWRLVQGRSRRAESQLRSFADFEIWSLLFAAIALGTALVAPVAIGIAPLAGILVAHAALCLGAACSIAMDRFVRLPAPMRLLAPPPHGLELPQPLVTVQRTATHSPNRPIVHPCATPAWAAVDVAVGVTAVWLMSRDMSWACAAGAATGLAAWLPSFVASRTRHQDALFIGLLSTALLVALAFVGLVASHNADPRGTLMMAALAGAAIGMWGLLLAWAAAGARHMATSARSALDAARDDEGDPAAPLECAMTVKARDEAMRRLAIACCVAAVAAAAVDGLVRGFTAPWTGPAIGSVVALVSAGAVAILLAVMPLDRLMPLARRIRVAMFATAAVAAIPTVLSAATSGVLPTISALPFAIGAAVLLFIAGAVLSGLVVPSTSGHPSRGLRSAASPLAARAATRRPAVHARATQDT